MLMLAGFHSSKKARYLQVTAQREQSWHQRRNHSTIQFFDMVFKALCDRNIVTGFVTWVSNIYLNGIDFRIRDGICQEMATPGRQPPALTFV
jgi:hypothetical protein